MTTSGQSSNFTEEKLAISRGDRERHRKQREESRRHLKRQQRDQRRLTQHLPTCATRTTMRSELFETSL